MSRVFEINKIEVPDDNSSSICNLLDYFEIHRETKFLRKNVRDIGVGTSDEKSKEYFSESPTSAMSDSPDGYVCTMNGRNIKRPILISIKPIRMS